MTEARSEPCKDPRVKCPRPMSPQASEMSRAWQDPGMRKAGGRHRVRGPGRRAEQREGARFQRALESTARSVDFTSADESPFLASHCTAGWQLQHHRRSEASSSTGGDGAPPHGACVLIQSASVRLSTLLLRVPSPFRLTLSF